MKRTARKERELARVRQDILESAARAFARGGFHGTTMEDIASEAGFAVGSLYNYFRGKDEIYSSLLDTIAEEFERVYDMPQGSSLAFLQRLEWILHRNFELVERRREFFVMFLQQHGSLEWAAAGEEDNPVRQRYLRVVDRLQQLLQQGIAEGALRPLDARSMTYFTTGALNTVISHWVGGTLEGSLTDKIPMLLDMLLAGIGNPPEGR
jgi:AcrR family transcriptional regulator